MKLGHRMIHQVIRWYASVFSTLSFAVCLTLHFPNSLEKKLSIFFDFFGKLDVAALFLEA